MNSALPLLGLLLPMLVQSAQPNEALLQQAVSEGRIRPFHELMEVLALIVLLGIRWNTALLFEAALLVAMLGFASTVALARYLSRGDVVE